MSECSWQRQEERDKQLVLTFDYILVAVTHRNVKRAAEQRCHRPLTQTLIEEGWPGAGRLVDAEVVDWHTREGHADPHQRVDRVTVERNHHQEDAAHAVDYWEKQGELQENREMGLKLLRIPHLSQTPTSNIRRCFASLTR